MLVVNYNSGAWLKQCVASLQAQTLQDFEVIIVDNASQDGSDNIVLPDDRFRLHRAGENLGFAAANNLAAKGANAPWLAMLNPDAIAAADWLDQLLKEAEAHREAAIFGSTQLRAEEDGVLDGTGDCLSAFGPSWRSGYGNPAEDPLPEGEVFAACGAAMMISRHLFEQLGGFEESFFCYMEDVDLCYRARLAGALIWQSSRARVAHAGGGSTEAGESTFSMYHGYRNSIWMLLRCTPWPLLMISLPGLITFMLLRMTRIRAPGKNRALWQGMRDGLLGGNGLLRQRCAIKRQRGVSVAQVASWLSWNPRHILRRHCVVLKSNSDRQKNFGP